ncbi:MAG: YhfC family intramembrane metalloprotease, partial [Deltaproteobacteria bacterium]|nr:YhfC family intramembrane metalloprotease [Deltaproteobacteria bacterium]
VPGLDPDSMGLPADQVEQLYEAQQQLTTMPWWLPVLGGLERIFAMCVQISMAVLVVQCFVRGSIKWLWIAIGYHAFIDFVAVFAHQMFVDSRGMTWGTVATEGLVAMMAISSLGIILRLRPKRRAEP